MGGADQGKRLKNRELADWVYSDRSEIHGTGLFARVEIEAGQYIGTYHGPEA